MAFKLYVADDFKHHNAFFKGDKESLIIAMEQNAATHPNKIFEIKRALEEDNLVAVHSRVIIAVLEIEMAMMHIFRFEHNKIAELWDFGQTVPKNIVNENGMF